jgi:predicted RNA-binding Zn-ribbon protein involved in translation (DUF1610 family)
MFIPKRCPKCRDHAQWTEIYNPHFTNGLEKLICIVKGYGTKSYIYRCGKCGYEGEYDNHAEDLTKYRPIK